MLLLAMLAMTVRVVVLCSSALEMGQDISKDKQQQSFITGD